MNLQVMDVGKRKITKHIPAGTAILADVNACISANIKQILPDRVLPDDIHRPYRYVS